ncbi:MAG: hypothetical protein KTR28_00705 [Micavibrio sp.]|nr:hypothetical protein [Micavibrio sp.]
MPNAQEILDQIEGIEPIAAPVGSAKLYFQPNIIELSETHKREILDRPDFISSDHRLKILSYATVEAGDQDTMSARRISLERAIIVKNFLKDSGVASTRIDIFPMGDQINGDPRDYVIVSLDSQ